MKNLLSSRLTLFNKIIFPVTWTLIIMGTMIFIYIDSNDPKTIVMLIMLLPILIPLRIQQVTYDESNIYVYNWRRTKTYPLKDIKAINEGNLMSYDPFFEIEIRKQNGTIEKVDFMPKVSEQLKFMFRKEYSGRLQDIRDKILASKES